MIPKPDYEPVELSWWRAQPDNFASPALPYANPDRWAYRSGYRQPVMKLDMGWNRDLTRPAEGGFLPWAMYAPADKRKIESSIK